MACYLSWFGSLVSLSRCYYTGRIRMILGRLIMLPAVGGGVWPRDMAVIVCAKKSTSAGRHAGRTMTRRQAAPSWQRSSRSDINICEGSFGVASRL
ncbi:hypothetical protein BKA80DRAFT_259922 [Phyllosticta citrichinensis]